MRRTEAAVGMAPLESLKVTVLQSRRSASLSPPAFSQCQEGASREQAEVQAAARRKSERCILVIG